MQSKSGKKKRTVPVAEFDSANKANFDLISLDQLADSEDAHSHDFYAVIWFTRGNGSHLIDFKTYPIAPYRFHFFAPGKIHHMQRDEAVEGIALSFTEAFLTGPETINPVWYDYAFFSYFQRCEFVPEPDDRPLFIRLLDQMKNESESHYADRYLAIQKYLSLLLLEINRRYSGFVAEKTNDKKEAYFRDFMLLLNKHFRSERSVNFYAKQLGVSSSHLSACARAVSGMSISHLIQERTLLEIQRLLMHTRLSIYRIAVALNFEESGYMIKFFKKHTGQTPKEFREG